MKCYSIRKEDNFVTVCVLCTLSFWKSDYYHRIYLPSCPWCRFTHRCTCWGFISEVKLQKVYHSRFIIPVSLTCKYLEDGDLALSGPLSLSNSTSVFPLCSCPLQSFVPPPLVLFILSFWLCQQYCTVQHLGVFDKQTGLLGLQRPLHLLSTYIPSPNLTNTFYFSTFPVYTCTVLLLVLWWRFLHICLSSRLISPHDEVEINHKRGEDDHKSHQHRHISLSLKLWTPPPVNMNVTCILCI